MRFSLSSRQDWPGGWQFLRSCSRVRRPCHSASSLLRTRRMSLSRWMVGPRARRTHDATSGTWRPPASTSSYSRRWSCRGRLGPRGATDASEDARVCSAMPSPMRTTPPSASYARSASPAHALTRTAAREGRRSPRPHLLPRPLSRPPRGGLPPPPSLARPSTLPTGRVRDQRRSPPPFSDFECGRP